MDLTVLWWLYFNPLGASIPLYGPVLHRLPCLPEERFFWAACSITAF